MAAIYDGMEFRTALEARWAAFFDLADWTWRCNPAAVDDWKPDFEVTFPCSHSECNGSHTLLVSILPVADLAGVHGHPALHYSYFRNNESDKHIDADAGALFGTHPSATTWEMAHGAGGGTDSVPGWRHDSERLWAAAGERVTCLLGREGAADVR